MKYKYYGKSIEAREELNKLGYEVNGSEEVNKALLSLAVALAKEIEKIKKTK